MSTTLKINNRVFNYFWKIATRAYRLWWLLLLGFAACTATVGYFHGKALGKKAADEYFSLVVSSVLAGPSSAAKDEFLCDAPPYFSLSDNGYSSARHAAGIKAAETILAQPKMNWLGKHVTIIGRFVDSAFAVAVSKGCAVIIWPLPSDRDIVHSLQVVVRTSDGIIISIRTTSND